MTADPLIDEANQRKRRRRLLIAAVLAAVALAGGLWFGFRPSGVRRGYYSPSGADALVMMRT